MSTPTTVPSTRRLLVAGTAGGVGTTTVTALLFGAWTGRAGAPQLADHTGGALGRRLAGGDDVGRLDERTTLQDAGPIAFDLGKELTDPTVRLVLVSAATRTGCALADDCLATLRGTAGASAASRSVVVLAEIFGRHRLTVRARELAARQVDLGGLLVLPADPALAAGGRIRWASLRRRTRHAVDELAGLAGDQRTVPGVKVSR